MSSYPSRRSIRLRDYDYSRAGAYFVTLCINQRLPLLGHIAEGEMHLSAAGAMVAAVWNDLGRYYPVEVDAFVVMPNHLHGILVLLESDGQAARGGSRAYRDGSTVPTKMHGQQDLHTKGSMSLSTVIQRFKTFTIHGYGKGVTREGWPRCPGRLWQQRFYEHVIRHERELAAIREYIVNNPLQWELDRENPDRIR